MLLPIDQFLHFVLSRPFKCKTNRSLFAATRIILIFEIQFFSQKHNSYQDLQYFCCKWYWYEKLKLKSSKFQQIQLIYLPQPGTFSKPLFDNPMQIILLTSEVGRWETLLIKQFKCCLQWTTLCILCCPDLSLAFQIVLYLLQNAVRQRQLSSYFTFFTG